MQTLARPHKELEVFFAKTPSPAKMKCHKSATFICRCREKFNLTCTDGSHGPWTSHRDGDNFTIRTFLSSSRRASQFYIFLVLREFQKDEFNKVNTVRNGFSEPVKSAVLQQKYVSWFKENCSCYNTICSLVL